LEEKSKRLISLICKLFSIVIPVLREPLQGTKINIYIYLTAAVTASVTIYISVPA